ncbi:MAG: hypothetical protein JO104_02470, partial [Candidatus Eremiobacteraeota bacterium]|nr:hypothetical protein [Candidatus Eremiobacteraeota bacterium]
MTLPPLGRRALAGVFAILLAACGSTSAPSVPRAAAFEHATRPDSGSTPIQHIVLMIQENRSFNDCFAGFPGAVGTKVGEKLVRKRGSGYVEVPVNLSERNLSDRKNLTHDYPSFLRAYQNGAMDGFNLIKFDGKPEGRHPYEYVNPAQIAPYWDIASQWGLADDLFMTQGSESFIAHQDLIRGGTFVSAGASLIDAPTSSLVWGCDSAKGTKTSLITTALRLRTDRGPFPCSNKFRDYGSDGYKTLRDLLDAQSISWKYYTPQFEHVQPNGIWNAFDVIAPVRYGPEWTTNISSPETNIFNDISAGTLPAMSWVIPDAQNSDHPGYSFEDKGPSWVASVVNAIGGSSYWDSTVVIVVWDDWGGFYDPVAPPLPRDNQGGPGFRVPMLVISPFVQVG